MFNILHRLITRKFYSTKEIATSKVTQAHNIQQLTDNEKNELLELIDTIYVADNN